MGHYKWPFIPCKIWFHLWCGSKPPMGGAPWEILLTLWGQTFLRVHHGFPIFELLQDDQNQEQGMGMEQIQQGKLLLEPSIRLIDMDQLAQS